jgi:aspartate racemase
MRLLGVLGGMSWTSTEAYYRLLNTQVAQRLGGLHSARLLVHSVDFDPIAELQHSGDWAGTAEILGEAALGLAAGGAEGLLLATNTMHKVGAEIEEASGLRLIHIADATAQAVLAAGLHRVGLLATAFTMEDAFYVERLATRGSRRWSRRPPSGPRCTGSSTTSWSSTWSAPSRASSSGR